MNYKNNIIRAFHLNLGHRRDCELCFRTTSALNFWIWDPNEEGGYTAVELADLPPKNQHSTDIDKRLFACILLNPTHRQKKESLEVRCQIEFERTFAALDKCLIQDGRKCEGLLFWGKENSLKLYWIELKMEMKIRNPQPRTLEDRLIGEGENGGAFEQILAARNAFTRRGVEINRFSNKGHIGIPQPLVKLAQRSDAIKKKIIETRKREGLIIGYGPTLSLGD